MSELNLGSLLYAYKGESVEVIDTLIGRVGALGMGISSLHPASAMTGPKMSAAGCLFDLMFRYPGTIAVAYCEDMEMLYVEINKAQYFVTATQFSRGGDPVKPKYDVIPLVLHQCLCGNPELRALFNLIVETADKTGGVAGTDIFKFCDAFYYGYAVTAKVTEATFTKDEAQATFRTNKWEKYDFGYPKYFGELREFTPKGAKAKKAKKDSSAFMDEVKAGKYRIAYEWADEIKDKIVKESFLDTFEVTPEFEEIVKKIKYRADRILNRMDMGMTGADAIGKDALNILMLGKPGTGKTTIAYAVSAACHIPICTTAHTKHTDEDEYEGKTKIVESKPTFVETDSLLMHTFGGIDVCEEINLADPSVTMGGLGQKLEYPYIVKANGYKTIVRHPLNVVIGTLNVGTNGSNPLNQALANRFKSSFLLDDPTEDTFINILIKASGKSKEMCEWVYSAYAQTVTYLKSPEVNEDEICQNLSIRTCLGVLDNMDEGQSPKRALVNSIIGAIAVVDLEIARKAQTEVIELLPEYREAS